MYLPAPDQVLASRDVDVDADATRSSSAVAPTASSPASDGDVVSVSSDGDLVVVSSLDDEYLGRRVEVYWPNDDPPTWYPGVVARFDPNRQHARYRVDYDDGADEWVDFPEPTVRFVSWTDWARDRTAEELVEWTENERDVEMIRKTARAVDAMVRDEMLLEAAKRGRNARVIKALVDAGAAMPYYRRKSGGSGRKRLRGHLWCMHRMNEYDRIRKRIRKMVQG